MCLNVVYVELAVVNLVLAPPSSPNPRRRRQPGLESRNDPRSTRPATARPIPTRPIPTRPKGSVPSSVASFFRRATTGRQSPEPLSGQSGSKANRTASHETTKRGGIPSILKKKASELFSARTADNKRAEQDPAPTSSRPPPHTRHLPQSPTRTVRTTETSNLPSKLNISSTDILDDGNMHSAKDIRAAILVIEAEAERVLDEFNNLEQTTAQRVHLRTVRRLPSATQIHASSLIEGQEWHDRRFQPPSSPRVSDWKRRIPLTVDISDTTSVRSGSSNITSLSQSKSISSLRSRQAPGSALSPRFPTPPPLMMHRKNSVSSISSQTTSSRLGANRNLGISQSTGHLPLGMLAEKDGMQSRDSVSWGIDDGDVPAEVADIRKRSREVAARYDARIQYLQAKLKGAKLHEKLLKK